MGKIIFYLNKSKGTLQNRPIMLSYHFNGQRLFYYTGHRISEKEFSPDSKLPAKPECIDRILINGKLKLIRDMIGNIEIESLANGKVLTTDLFRTALNDRLKARPTIEQEPEQKITLLQFFESYIKELPNKVNKQTGRKLSKAMPVKYGTIKNLFEDFCTFEGRQYDFEDINQNFYNRFLAFMLNQKNYSVNTYGYSFKILKSVLSEAAKRGLNNFTDYKTLLIGATEDADSIYLNEDELKKINDLDLSEIPARAKVRDLFLIGCYTGLRFSDYTTISPDDIKSDRLRVQAQKTNKKVVIPLAPEAMKILQYYNFQLPKAISNQKFNEALKLIAEKAKINEIVVTNITKGGVMVSTSQSKYKLVSSHVARRSFATNAIKHGVEPMLVMAITGHKTEKEFLKYIKLSNDEKADLFAKNMNW